MIFSICFSISLTCHYKISMNKWKKVWTGMVIWFWSLPLAYTSDIWIIELTCDVNWWKLTLPFSYGCMHECVIWCKIHIPILSLIVILIWHNSYVEIVYCSKMPWLDTSEDSRRILSRLDMLRWGWAYLRLRSG